MQPATGLLASLRHVTAGGEAMPAALRDRFHQLCDAQLHNFYGPTEASVWATAYAVPRNDASTNISIGKPLDNVSIYILDDAGKPAAAGQIGEICIGGLGVGQGYLRRPELTSERFIPNSIGPEGGRLYRSGDLGRWRDDGLLECLGRADQQIKLRGFRIELGEIEAQIEKAFPGAAAAVVASGDSAANQMLVARLVVHLSQIRPTADKRKRIADRSPGVDERMVCCRENCWNQALPSLSQAIWTEVYFRNALQSLRALR